MRATLEDSQKCLSFRARCAHVAAVTVLRGRVCAWLLLGVLTCCARQVHAAPPGTMERATDDADLPAPRARDGAFRRGVTLGPLVAPESPEAFKRAQVKRLARAVALGATDVRLLVRWTHSQPDAVELAPFDRIDDELLAWLISASRARKLRVWLCRRGGREPGRSASRRRVAPTSWDRWCGATPLRAALPQVARARKVPLLAVGSGLTSTEPTGALAALIRDVRKGTPAS